MKDLLVLVADKNMQFALKGALPRHEALGTRPFEYDFIVHSGHDGGARKSGAALLALKRQQFTHALLLLDFEGCGDSSGSPTTLERRLDDQLFETWGANAKSIVIEPELDIWMWGSDNAIEEIVGWKNPARVREWISARGYGLGSTHKPLRPKEALEAALRETGQPRSSALYQKIAAKISLPRCADPAFQRLKSALANWFPPQV